MDNQTTLSVTLLTCNRLDVTKKTLKYLLATTHVDYELVIVHNHNHTKQAQKVLDFFKNTKLNKPEKLKRVVKVFNPNNRGVAGGRNDGMHYSTGKHRVVIDDDILAPDCWAEEMLGLVEDDGEAEANARLIAESKNLFEALKEIIKISDRKHDAWDNAKAILTRINKD